MEADVLITDKDKRKIDGMQQKVYSCVSGAKSNPILDPDNDLGHGTCQTTNSQNTQNVRVVATCQINSGCWMSEREVHEKDKIVPICNQNPTPDI